MSGPQWWLRKDKGAPQSEVPYTWDSHAEVDLGEKQTEPDREGDAPTDSDHSQASAGAPRRGYHAAKARWPKEQRGRCLHDEAHESQRHSPESSGEDVVQNEDEPIS